MALVVSIILMIVFGLITKNINTTWIPATHNEDGGLKPSFS